ncbi:MULTISPECIES: carbohydrate ABC transporter permease [Cohnella]|uniref:carbohydrate ABC transporter permease n=1 Tax=Cohnella TaxID=329857 RepID=UPI0009BB5983|nr:MULTISPECIES: carbohydrate ABC transporter permease [Cohnella]MBN2982446.1 carbohydrate ABC transporter permease [Cohnella algarum]
MVQNRSLSAIIFHVFNYAFLGVMALLCVLPLVHVLAVSFSSSTEAEAGLVSLWPIDFTADSYRYVLNKPEFFKSLGVTLQKVSLGTALNLLLVILLAYPLSRETKEFPMRTFYAWAIVFTMLFNGGLVPTYMVVRETQIMDTIWALVLPGAIPVFHVVMLLNFFRGIPKELVEAAHMDGAGHWTVLRKIMLPLSIPALATLLLFNIVGHWNSWFDGLIYMNSPENYPLQTYLRTIIIELDFTALGAMDAIHQLENVSERTTRAAQIFLGALPVMLVYPFLQNYFMKGIVLGSVKG